MQGTCVAYDYTSKPLCKSKVQVADSTSSISSKHHIRIYTRKIRRREENKEKNPFFSLLSLCHEYSFIFPSVLHRRHPTFFLYLLHLLCAYMYIYVYLMLQKFAHFSRPRPRSIFTALTISKILFTQTYSQRNKKKKI